MFHSTVFIPNVVRCCHQSFISFILYFKIYMFFFSFSKILVYVNSIFMSRTVPYARQNCTSVCAADKIWIRFGIWACKNKTALFYVRPTQLAIRWGERKPWTSSEQVSSSDLRTSHHVWFRQSRSFACDFGTQLGWESSNVCDRLPLLNKHSIFYFLKKNNNVSSTPASQ